MEPLESRHVFAAPTLGALANVTLLSGAPLHVALDGFDADGDAITYEVSSSNPNVAVIVPTQVTGLKFHVVLTDAQGNVKKTYGDMLFQSFDDLAPNTTAHIKELVESGFYNNLSFHRIIKDFMIQGGDPTGTGSGGSDLGDINDEFNGDLQFTSKGILAMAKSLDDTGDSQFFITAEATRWLDFQHTIFGFQTEGDAVREAIENDVLASGDKVVMQTVSLFDDDENGVLRLKTLNGATSGTSTITVKARDSHGNETTSTFQVTIAPDTENGAPFLSPLPEKITVTQGEQVTLALTGFDVEGDSIKFDRFNATGITFTFSQGQTVSTTNGFGTVNVTISPSATLVGKQTIGFWVQRPNQSFTGIDTRAKLDGVVDVQLITLEIIPKAPLGVAIDSAQDTGPSNTDGVTSVDTNLKFKVAGVLQGATVNLMRGDEIIGTATAPAAPSGQNPTTVVVDVTLKPGVTLNEGLTNITAVQIYDGLTSVNSQSLALVIDKSLPSFVSTAPASAILAGLDKPSLYNAQTNEEAGDYVKYQLIAKPSGMTIHETTGVVSWFPQTNQIGSHQVVIRATDKAGNFTDQTFNLTVQTNAAPQLDAIENKTIDEGQTLSLNATADDADIALGDALTYSLVGDVPAGASIQSSTGVFSWTPVEAHGPGTYNITVRVTDLAGNHDDVTFQVTVNDVPQPPVLATVANKNVKAGESLSVQLSASDPDEPPGDLTYSIESGAPAGMTINPATGLITWNTSAGENVTQYNITVKVTDVTGLSDTKSFTVSVVTPPVITAIADKTVGEGETLSFLIQATSQVTPTPTFVYELVSGPAGAAVNGPSGSFGFTPNETQGGNQYSVTVKVTDSNGLSATKTFNIAVAETNVAPILAPIANQKVARGANLQVQATATDADLPANSLSYSLEPGAPAGMTIDAGTGLLQWNAPNDAPVGPLSVTVKVSDGVDSHTRTFTVSVIAPPTINEIAAQTVNEGSQLSVTVTAQSEVTPTPTFTYSLTAAPVGAVINPTTGVFTWTPTEAQGPAPYLIQVKVVDSNGLEAIRNFNVTVNEVNQAPVLAAIPPKTAAAGSTLSFVATAHDPDIPSGALTYGLVSGAPAGLVIDEATGAILWHVPDDEPAGQYAVTVRVRDEAGETDEQTFTITVQSRPSIAAIDNQLTFEGAPFNLQVHAVSSVVPTPRLVYSLGNGAPAGAGINPNTGLITWTPNEAQDGQEFTLTVVVTDSNGLSEQTSFNVIVEEVNQPPSLAPIVNAIATPGEEFTVQAQAVDADLPAQSLLFSLVSGPEGATIDPQTGQFRWTPSESQAEGPVTITIRVTDSGSPELFTETSFTLSFGDPAVALIPGGGPGLPSFVSPSFANTNINPAIAAPLTNLSDGAASIVLAGSAGAPVTLGGYDDGGNSGTGESIGVVSEFQIGADTGVGSQVRPGRRQRVRKPTDEGENVEPATHEEAPNEESQVKPAAGIQHAPRNNAARPVAPPEQQTDVSSETDAALAMLEFSPGDIVMHQLLSRQSKDGLQIYSTTSDAAPTGDSPRVNVSPAETNSVDVTPDLNDGAALDAAGAGHQISRFETQIAATATAMFMPLLVTELADEPESKKKRGWWKKPR